MKDIQMTTKTIGGYNNYCNRQILHYRHITKITFTDEIFYIYIDAELIKSSPQKLIKGRTTRNLLN